MPNKQAAMKALRQSVKARARNVAEMARIRKAQKQAKKAIAAKTWDDAKAHVRAVGKALDKAVAHGVLTKNAAARTKSRIMSALNTAMKAS